MNELPWVPLNRLANQPEELEIIEKVVDVIKSGFYVHGPEHAEFQNELARYLGAKFALGVASGTDAIEIGLRALGCNHGSKIITVANAGGYTSVAARSIGCEVLYCDVDPETLLLDLHSLENLLTEEIQVVVVTHLYGNIAQIHAIVEMCSKFGVAVLEDCAQAIGGKEKEDFVGTIGDIGCFSFYPTKNLGAMGDGGALVTNSPATAERIERLRQYGWSEKYRIEIPFGMNSRLDELQAAILRFRLKNIDSVNEIRRGILEKYSESIMGSMCRLITSFTPKSSAHLAILQFPTEKEKNSFQEKMFNFRIKTDVHYPFLDCDQPGLKSVSTISELPESRKSLNKILTLPLSQNLKSDEISRICIAIEAVTSATR